MDKTCVYQKNPNFVDRVIEDETILLPIASSTDEANYIYTLNDCASFFWAHIDGKKSLNVIVGMIQEAFDSTEEAMQTELQSLIDDLMQIDAIQKVA